MADPSSVAVRPVPSEATHVLRMTVLRPSQPPSEVVYPGDDDPRTVHFGAFLDGELVGIASLYAEARVDGSEPGWRLRGMATDPRARRRGVGRALLDACIGHVTAEGGGELWCNARLVAVSFYAAGGFEVVSERFEIPGIGPHVVMRRLLPAARSFASDRR